MRLFEYVAEKLVALVVGSLLIFFGLATWYNLRVQERATRHILSLNGAQLADLVAGATRDAMLHNDQHAIQSAIDTLSRQRDIARIRVLAKSGLVAYSSRPAEVGQMQDASTQQCQSCHRHPVPLESLPVSQMVRRAVQDGRAVLEVTLAIRNEPECSGAPCHVHPSTEKLLGIMDVNLDLEPYEKARRSSAIQLVVSSLVTILLVSVVTTVAVGRMVRTPVRRMIRGAEALAQGDHSVRIPEVSNDELGQLARAFNRMSRDLERAHSELLEWAQTLELRVRQKSEELERAQDQIVRVERLASLGKLAAIVAHELNNPLSSVVTYAKLLIRRCKGREETDALCHEGQQYLHHIASEASRCGEIVSQLLSFARQRGGQFSRVDLNPVVEKALFLVNHKLEMAAVRVEKELAPDLQEIQADANQIQQALMALVINACEAMEKGGMVKVRTANAEGGVLLEVEDNGPGMTEEVAAHVYEPFFTTKTGGTGVGLGLAVVYGIVRRHGGRIQLKTAVGEGCRFSVFLPALPLEAEQEESP
jgi:two-component system NtrC family sensor kinase